MTIVLPQDYHAKAALEKSRVICISTEEALREIFGHFGLGF